MYLLIFLRKTIREREFHTLFNELRLKINILKWKRKYKDFNYYYRNRQWAEAIQAGEKDLEIGLIDQALYQKMANSYVKKGHKEQGKRYMKKALILNGRISKKELIQTVEMTVFSYPVNVQSTFVYLGGSDNLGFIQHLEETADGTKEYLTKIVPTEYPLDHFAYKEKYFHEKVRSQSATLQEITPQMTGFVEVKEERLLLMTFPLLRNDKISRQKIHELIAVSEKISTAIPAEEVETIVKVTDTGKAYRLSSLMHKHSTHVLIFRSIRRKINTLEQSAELRQYVDRFEAVILGLALYKKIDPTTDYFFAHGDFNENNILYDEKKERYQVIDWSSYGLALKGFDLVKLFVSNRLSFTEIIEEYMDQIFKEDEKAQLDRVFFVYMLFIQMITRLDLEEIEEEIIRCIAPAADYIEEQIQQSVYRD